MKNTKTQRATPLILFIFGIQSISVSYADPSPSPSSYPRRIPLFCKKALDGYYGENYRYASCFQLFDLCEAADGATDRVARRTVDGGPGKGHDIIDQVIKAVVAGRIHNLYLGFDSIGVPKTNDWLRGSDVLTLQNGFGSCAHVGACNQFCGEGRPSGVNFNLSTVMSTSSPLPAPNRGGHGLVPNQSVPLVTFTDTTHISSSALNVQARDFYAKGVLALNAGNGTLRAIDSNTEPTGTAGSGTDAEGWPEQTFPASHYPQPSPTSGCQTESPSDQRDFSRNEGYHTTTTGQLNRMEDFQLTTFTWNDSSYPLAGNAGCNLSYSMDFKNASTIAALQTGALVQANWMALQDVVDELRTNNFTLNITDPVCGALAQTLLNTVENTTLPDIFPGTDSCTRPLATVYQKCFNPTGLDRGNQRDCDILAAILIPQSTGFVNVATCEVVKRAEVIFARAFKSTTGRQWVNQLKSYAAESCMQSINQYMGDASGFDGCDMDLSRCTSLSTEAAKSACINKLYSLDSQGNTTTGDSCSILSRGTTDSNADACLGPHYDYEKTAIDCASSMGSNSKAVLSTCKKSLGACAAAAAAGAAVPLIGLVAGPAAAGACYAMFFAAKAPANVCIEDDTSTTLDKLTSAAWGGTSMANCFPYAYSAALYEYLKAMNFREVDIQKSYTSRRTASPTPLPSVIPGPQIFIKDCQFTDADPGFTPRQKPSMPQPNSSSPRPSPSVSPTVYNRLRLPALFFSWLFGEQGAFASPIRNSLRMQGRTVNHCYGLNGILLVGRQAEACCSTGTSSSLGVAAASPTPSNGVPCPDGLQIDTSIANAAPAWSTSATSAQAHSVRSLNGPIGTNPTSVPSTVPVNYSNNGETSAAGDSNQISTNRASPTGNPQGSGGTPNPRAGGRQGGGFGGTGAGASDGGTGVSTSPASAPSGTSDSILSEVAAALSSSGGGAKGGASSGRGGSAGATSSYGGTTGSMNFGSGSGSGTGNSASAMLSEDPEDYFTKINLDDSLFKIIHKRYQIKTADWFKI